MRLVQLIGVASLGALSACASGAASGPVDVEPPALGASDAGLVRPSASAAARRARPVEPGVDAGEALAIEQDGRVVPIVQHEARILRRPFTLVVRIRGGGRAAMLGTEVGVRLNASFDPRVFDLAVAGKPMPVADGEPFGGGSAMAEYEKPEPTLFLADGGSHFWYWKSDDDNRCASVAREGDDILCRRPIENLWDVDDGSGPEPISAERAPALHVVTLQAPSETAHGWVKLTFGPP